MTPIGIEKIGLYAPRLCVSALDLAEARGRERVLAAERFRLDTRSVAPPWEDAVTLAVNAARAMLTPDDAAAVELLVVGSESAVDFGKPISTWVHRFCGLPAACRNFEVKHACYGATAGLKTALWWLRTRGADRRKALVIGTDLTRPHPQDGYDFAGGAVAVALLVSTSPDVLDIDPDRGGFWTGEITDTFRPTASTELGDNELSLFSYLDGIEGAYEHFESKTGPLNYDTDFAGHIYHAPFPGMTFEAHRTMLQRSGARAAAEIESSFAAKVEPGLHYARLLGTAYGSSNFVCLLGMLRESQRLEPASKLSLFLYGSGCQAEFYEAAIGPAAAAGARVSDVDRHLENRAAISLGEYEVIEQARHDIIEQPCCKPVRTDLRDRFDERYQGRKLLVLEEVRNFRRHYVWS